MHYRFEFDQFHMSQNNDDYQHIYFIYPLSFSSLLNMMFEHWFTDKSHYNVDKLVPETNFYFIITATGNYF